MSRATRTVEPAPATSGWHSLGTGVSISVTDPPALSEVRTLLERELEAIDLACSRFRADSELTRVNTAKGRWVHVSPLFLEVLEAALRAARLTAGAVDPTIGRSLRLTGYDDDFTAIRERTSLRAKFVATPGWQSIEIDEARAAVRLPSGVELDFGATAKALAADRAAKGALALTGTGVLINLGGDLAMSGYPPRNGWVVRVTDDHGSGFDAPGQSITFASGGLATSSTAVRAWDSVEGRLHHILDPATGRPAAAVWRTVSVAAASCVDANTASTAAIVRGEGALSWLRSLELPARLVGVDGRVARVAGWPAP